MHYFHKASVDELTKTGFTLLQGYVGGVTIDEFDWGRFNQIRDGGEWRSIGIRIVIDVRVPFSRVNIWFRTDLFWMRCDAGSSEFCCGLSNRGNPNGGCRTLLRLSAFK